eukprot:7383816-Prymnesium_polylepis.1
MLPPRPEALEFVVHLHQPRHEWQLQHRITQRHPLEVAPLEQLRERRLRLARADALHCLDKLDVRSSADVAQTPILEVGDAAAARAEERERREPITLLVDRQQQGLYARVDKATVDDAPQSWRVRPAVARDCPPQQLGTARPAVPSTLEGSAPNDALTQRCDARVDLARNPKWPTVH